jgi:hypothetical protein
MSRQLHISTESHYLRAHLTVIAGESYDQRGAFHDLRRRATSLWKLFTNRIASVAKPRTCSSKRVSMWT